ncbi:MAG TPA: carbohydrate ABC transporter permease [Caldilineaceae bacterium]|nr:carbohydrate ABC transporter permease [Caldilineaceae bacterium]
MSKRLTAGRLIRDILFWIIVLVIAFYTLFPFYWAVASSLTPASQLFSTPVRYFPANPTLDSYRTVFANDLFRRALINSAFVAGSTVILSLLIGSFGAYALGRLVFRGKSVVLYTILSMTMFPAIAILGSLFTMVRTLGIYNTPYALILTYLTFTLPFTVWVLSNFFKSLPAELEQAAFVDGATPFQTFYMILLPLTAPGLVTTGLLAFIEAWNEFLYALTFTIDANARTVPVAIAYFTGEQQFEIPWADIMAATVVVTIPLVVLVLVFQQRLVEGLTAGAVKG